MAFLPSDLDNYFIYKRSVGNEICDLINSFMTEVPII